MEDQQSTVGPLAEILRSIAEYVWSSTAGQVPPDLQWPSLFLTLLLSIALYFYRSGRGSRGADGRERQRSFLSFILPADIYGHVSARVDVGLWLLGKLLYPLWAVALLATVGPAAEAAMMSLLDFGFGSSPALQVNLAWMLVYSLVILLFYDFIFYLTHLAFHKVPILWPIHQVHHSAEVLTPLTRHREHFLAGPIWAGGAALSYGLAAGLFGFLFVDSIAEATLLNIGFFTLLFGFNGTFRHYHIQFRYPRWLEKWLQSPGMHHVHHSYLPQHIDTNFAAVTSIWDRVFNTLYIPQQDEFTPWGTGPDGQDQHRSFWQNTIGPFKEWYVMINRTRRKLWKPQPQKLH